jgi:hypothetical protein
MKKCENINLNIAIYMRVYIKRRHTNDDYTFLASSATGHDE